MKLLPARYLHTLEFGPLLSTEFPHLPQAFSTRCENVIAAGHEKRGSLELLAIAKKRGNTA
jgi:hypothetical protein